MMWKIHWKSKIKVKGNLYVSQSIKRYGLFDCKSYHMNLMLNIALINDREIIFGYLQTPLSPHSKSG